VNIDATLGSFAEDRLEPPGTMTTDATQFGQEAKQSDYCIKYIGHLTTAFMAGRLGFDGVGLGHIFV
jgi:hypothetical protein